MEVLDKTKKSCMHLGSMYSAGSVNMGLDLGVLMVGTGDRSSETQHSQRRFRFHNLEINNLRLIRHSSKSVKKIRVSINT